MISGEQAKPLLITNVRPVAFGEHSDTTTDILVGKDGNISAIGKSLNAPAEVERIDGKGAWISPGWVDLHVHIWHGGTDISIRPSECGAERGVTTLVDAGSAGRPIFTASGNISLNLPGTDQSLPQSWFNRPCRLQPGSGIARYQRY